MCALPEGGGPSGSGDPFRVIKTVQLICHYALGAASARD